MLSTSRTAPGAYSSIAHGAREIYTAEGWKGFYRGLVPSLFGVSHGAIQFMAYEQLKIWRVNRLAGRDTDFNDSPNLQATSTSTSNTSGSVGAGLGAGLRGEALGTKERPQKSVELSNWDFLSLSALSKIFAGSITYPYQVVRARLQTYDALTKYRGAMDVVRQVWRIEGLAGFYKGLDHFCVNWHPNFHD